MSNVFNRMQKLAGLITEGNEGSVDEAKASSLSAAKKKMTKKKLKEAIREMILNEVSEEKLDEAKKKKKDTEDTEDTENIEDINLDTEESTDIDGGMDLSTKTITPQDVQKELTDALEAAKGLGDEKLVRQIGNALTYFTRSQVSSGEENLREADYSKEYIQSLLDMTPEERGKAIAGLNASNNKVSQKKLAEPNVNPYKKSTLTRNEEFLQDIFREPFIAEIKKMVIDYLDNSDINDTSKKTMKYNIETINNRDRLIKYITNSILAYEGLGVNRKRKFEE